MNNFSLHLKFSTPADLTTELSGHSVMVLQSVFLADGASKAQVFLTVNGNRFVISSLSARRITSKLGLRITAADGDVKLSCSQGASIIVTGFIQEDSCCDHDHGEHEHEHEHGEGCCDHEHAEEEAVSEGDDVEVESADEELEEEDGDDEEVDSDDEDDEEVDSDDQEEDDEESDEEESEEEESEDEVKPAANKKVTFNAKEQGPHVASAKAEPLKPLLKQAAAAPAKQAAVAAKPTPAAKAAPVAPAKPESKVGTTVTMKGGLKYTILKEGTGPVATVGRRVNVRYVGCLASNGKRFDKGQIKFGLGKGEVIKGWDIGVTGMRVKESRRLLIPAHLGYGSRGAPPAIPGNAALAFEVELLDLH